MKTFLNNFLESERINPSHHVKHSLKKNFDNALKVDWMTRDDHFEAIFYKDNIEHLALFAKDGQLIEYKMNLSEDFLPLPAKSALPSDCEIMNVVLRNHGNSLSYEVIYRNKELRRFVMVIDELGKVEMEKELIGML